jgi:hypothetical protein
MIGRAVAGLIVSAALLGAGVAAADQTPPLPPVRPKAAPTLPTPVVPIAPDEQSQNASDEAVGTLPPRTRIERCATEWRDMKRVGTDVGLTWRNFARSCYKR